MLTRELPVNEPQNPYAPPTTRVADHEARPEPTDSGQFIPYGRSRPAGNGATWIGNAWRLLRARPGQWALAMVLLFIAYVLLSMIPFVSIFMQLLVPFAYAGIAIAADEQRRTGSFEISALMAGFNKRPASLVAVGGTVLVAYVVLGIFVAVVVGIDAFSMMGGSAKPDPSMFFTMKYLLVFLICLALMIPVAMATYLAPQLIVLHDQPAVTAMKMSLAGTVKNILPGIVFGICGLLLVILSAIPLLLGLLISIPIMVLTNYTVYRDIFVEDDE
jgi:uncharacterized membrane protein